MGQKNSKDELVYQQAVEGNVEAIKALSRDGARLEWVDKEGKTALIVASMDLRLYHVAKALIELGANLNAYRPGRHAGTPLHHAAKKGLDNTVKLLLSSGANPFVRNDDCQTALDVARAKGLTNVVRTIEAHICYFCGEIREVCAVPGILESLVPQRLSRKRSKKSWVVVLPCNLPNSRRPVKLELAVYSGPQDPQPRTVIALWNSKIVEPKFQESDPAMIIFDEPTKIRYKFLSDIEGDRQQLAQLYNACKGLPQVMPSSQPDSTVALPPSAEANAEAAELPNPDFGGWGPPDGLPSPSKPSCGGWGPPDTVPPGPPPLKESYSGWGPPDTVPPPSKASCSGWADEPSKDDYNGWGQSESQPTHVPTVPVPVNLAPAATCGSPSAPPAPDDELDYGPIQYPQIDVGPVVDFPVPAVQSEAGTTISSSETTKSQTEQSCCVICWEAPIEGACIPCGHMAGCMSCLSEIKAKKGVCPVCRANLDQVIRLYAV